MTLELWDCYEHASEKWMSSQIWATSNAEFLILHFCLLLPWPSCDNSKRCQALYLNCHVRVSFNSQAQNLIGRNVNALAACLCLVLCRRLPTTKKRRDVCKDISAWISWKCNTTESLCYYFMLWREHQGSQDTPGSDYMRNQAKVKTPGRCRFCISLSVRRKMAEIIFLGSLL